MWKKPSLEKPDFKKVNLEELSEKECIEINGGLVESPVVLDTSIEIIKSYKIKFPGRLSGIVAQNFDLTK